MTTYHSYTLNIAVIIIVQLLSTGRLLYLRSLPCLLQYRPELAVLALGVLGLVPAEGDLTVQPAPLLPAECRLQRLPAHT